MTKEAEIPVEQSNEEEITTNETQETTYDLFLKLLAKDKNIDFGYGF